MDQNIEWELLNIKNQLWALQKAMKAIATEMEKDRTEIDLIKTVQRNNGVM